MAKQRIIPQGDFGFVFDINMTDDKGQPIEILNDDVNAYIVFPDNSETELTDEALTIVDNIGGRIRIEIPKGFTEQVGNYTMYIELKGTTYQFNTKEGISYYVMARHGIGG